MLERDVVATIRKYLASLGCDVFFWKEHGGHYGSAGIPDIICCYKGRFLGLEAKLPGGKLTELQKRAIEKINRAGGIACRVESVDDVKAVIAQADLERRNIHLSDVQRSSMRYVIAAKATAQRIYENYGADLYTDMLRLIVETWDAVEWSLSKPVLNGCAVFLDVYGDEYKRDRFIRKLAYTNADELAAIARRQNAKDQPRQYALAILELYNKGGRGRLDESRVQR